MKALVGVLGILVVVALMVDSYLGDRAVQHLVGENRRFLAARDSALAIIREHADSARALQPRIEWRERVVTRLVTRTDTLSIQASGHADAGQWEAAYRTRTQEADTLRVALTVQTARAEDAIRMAAYWELAFIADSTRRHEAEDRLTVTTDALGKRTKWYARLGVSIGVDITGRPNVLIGVKVWP